MSYLNIKKSIEEASGVIGKTWPLYSFVTSNPLTGYENSPFEEAVHKAKGLLNTRVFPQASVFRQAWEKGEIEEKELKFLLKENGLQESPEFYLRQMESEKLSQKDNPTHQLDIISAKWLAAFMDEGLAEWDMPRKEEGFYTAWRELATFDNELNITHIREIPKTAEKALSELLENYEQEDYIPIFAHHLAALPGWTGYINYRTQSNTSWQQEYPIDLEDYLAVRLFIARQLGLALHPDRNTKAKEVSGVNLPYLWLKGWEKSWQNALQSTLEQNAITTNPQNEVATAAQLVFCIDTRSELIRRNVETKGAYETFGYAGFFGIAMDYTSPDDGFTRKSCPPIVGSAYTVTEGTQEDNAHSIKAYHSKKEQLVFFQYFLKRMKNMLPSAFGYVEGSGIFYGLVSLVRTLIPSTAYRFKKRQNTAYEDLCEPEINLSSNDTNLADGIPLDQKVAIVKGGFDLMGWKSFAPIVVFVGHGSHTANNPFASSLDCGACAASPGKHNARMLAKLANLPEVRALLLKEHGVAIPENTFFMGGQHNTTTDEILLFEYDVPSTHVDKLKQLKSDLYKAQKTATEERLRKSSGSIALAQKKANNWGETRPEWGLAKNAGFIIAPRSLTKEVNLDSRCFLHSYDWELDTTGAALEGIMQGPMVVTQWINNHYYFSTVANDTLGGGSKITHNITGRFGVVQGNGGDLKMGLPLQSVSATDDELYHRALRLSVLIKAPVQRVSEILLRNEHLKTLLDNEWIYLMVMDPNQNDEILQYKKNMQWVSTR